MDLTNGSLSFCVGSIGSIRLSDPSKSDLSVDKTTTMVVSESSIGSSSKVNCFTLTENMEEKIEELDETMENLDLGE
jgi:hypothetical protein